MGHLSGGHERGTFARRLQGAMLQAWRYHDDLALAIVEVDRYDELRDYCGTETADLTVTEVHRLLRGVQRESDDLSRIGDAQFAWMFPGTTGASAGRAVERARRAISGIWYPGVGHTTASAGICSLRDADDALSMVRCATVALRQARDVGEDIAVRYTPSGFGQAPPPRYVAPLRPRRRGCRAVHRAGR